MAAAEDDISLNRRAFGLRGKEYNALSVEIGYSSAPKDLHWLSKNIPCQAACPAGTDIPGYLEAIYSGNASLAYEINLEANVFPAVLGRVCSRPCEPECRHGWEGNGEPVAICFSKRSAADFKDNNQQVQLKPWFESTGKKVAVIGAGVGGLAAARELARFGHQVTVFEKHERPGGMMNQGIPVFRLPRDIIEREIGQVEACGVQIKCNTEIGKDISVSDLLNEHDAVVLAAGTLRPNMLDLPGNDLEGIEHGLNFLLEVNEKGRSKVGEHVVVIGGGYTAMDCARTAIRLGTKGLKVFYRRREDDLLILPDELVQLREEGGWMEFNCNPIEFIGENGHIKRIRFVRTKAGEPDANGRRAAVPIPNAEFEVQTDHVIMATGQFPNATWIDAGMQQDLVAEDGWLRSDESPTTSKEKVFVAGDFALGASTLIDAIGHAKDCARKVDTFLMGSERLSDVAEVQNASSTGRTRELDFIPVQEMPKAPIGERIKSFDMEVETGFAKDTAKTEASRCYLCHYKFEIDDAKCVLCDECLFVKPVDNCIVEVANLEWSPEGEIVGYQAITPGQTRPLYYSRLYIDQTQCIRCGACEKVCPTDAISIQKVSKRTVASDARASMT